MNTSLFSILVQESSSSNIPWWVWVILIVILLVILYFWFGRGEEETVAEAPKTVAQVETAVPAVVDSAKPDDLKRIEGIGPKVASLLNEAGITTFQQMVNAGAEKLESILDAASLQMIDAGTWPEQAKMAAAGDWEALAKFQDELKGGKRS
jgi:predicted flap endonuclease-1-like 5' DNA nuclease